MTPYWWTCTLLLTFLAVGPSQRTVFADDLQELSRSVRWRHLALQETPPDDLTVDVPHNVSTLRYAEWVYGTPGSPRIAIAVAATGDGGFVLYADGNRARGIRERDLVEGAGELRMLSLAAQQVVGDVVNEYPRQVLFRWKGGNADLSVATATRIEHTIHLDGDESGRASKTRQIDGNANGLFADTKDLLQIDLNHDDRFDPFLETFFFRPLMKVRGHRWFVRADRFGKRLRLEAATATGRVRVVTDARSKRDRIMDLIVTLSGDDGSVYSLAGVNAMTDLPVGRYAASVLFVRIKPEGTDRAWEFTFSRNGGIRAIDWLQVNEGTTVEFDPIGDLVLDAVVERSKRNETRDLNVQPRLFTGSGLLINLCRVDGMSSWSGPRCHVSLTDTGDQPLGQSSSGFT
jgi:hypothetical protein